jgi:hypothetical protein
MRPRKRLPLLSRQCFSNSPDSVSALIALGSNPGFAIPVNPRSFLMSNRALKIAIALSMVLAPPAASFARGGHGGGHGGFARPAGSAGTGNVPISGIPRGPGNAGGLNNTTIDPSGVGNPSGIARLPQPNIAVSMPPGGTQNPAAPPAMNLNQQALPQALDGGGRQPRADQVPSENNLMNPNDPINRENAALDHMINGICRGC